MFVSTRLPGGVRDIPILTLREHRLGNALLLELFDRHLGARFAWQLREVLLANVEAGEQSITLDLAQVESIDASILAALIGTIRRMGPGGKLAITHASASVRQTLSRTGMDAVLPMEACNDNVAAPLAA